MKNNVIKISVITIIFFINYIFIFAQTPDTITIANINNNIITIIYNQDNIKQTLAEAYGSGIVDSIEIININTNYYILGYGTSDNVNYIVAHKLIKNGNKLIHLNYVVIEFHSCTAKSNCSQCTLRNDAAGNITGCNCISTIPPTSSGYCNHKIEQKTLPYK